MHLIKDEGADDERSRGDDGDAEEYLKSKYKAMYQTVLLTYSFYMKRVEEMTPSELYDLFTLFGLLNLATRASDVGISGKEMVHFK